MCYDGLGKDHEMSWKHLVKITLNYMIPLWSSKNRIDTCKTEMKYHKMNSKIKIKHMIHLVQILK